MTCRWWAPPEAVVRGFMRNTAAELYGLQA